MFEALLQQIQELLLKKPHMVVAISGFAGSGKTFLANRLQEHFKLRDGQILHLDNLYAAQPRGLGMFDDYDWSLVTRILGDVHEGKRLQYQSMSFEGDSSVFDEPLPGVVILEGVQLFRPELMQAFDVSVWVNCPLELALDRARARDLAQGHDIKYMKRWDIEWGPRNEKYFNDYHPEELATFLYDEYR